MAVKRTMYQRKVDVDMLNYTVKSVLADVSSVSPLSEHIHINLTLIHCTTLTLVPEVFRKATKKTSGNSDTESHFHAVDSCQICHWSNDTINQSLECYHDSSNHERWCGTISQLTTIFTCKKSPN